MTTAWTLTAGDVIRGALENCQAIGVGEAVSPEDSEVCLRSLNGLLKELPIHGINWFKVSSSDAAVAWSSGTPDRVSFPADYFGTPALKYTDAAGIVHPLGQMTKPMYEAKNAAQTAVYPDSFYVAPDKTVYVHPVPTQDPGLKLSYQAIAGDATLTATPDVQQAFLSGLQDWLADKVALKFAPQEIRAELAQRAMLARTLMIQWSTESAPISFSVDNA